MKTVNQSEVVAMYAEAGESVFGEAQAKYMNSPDDDDKAFALKFASLIVERCAEECDSEVGRTKALETINENYGCLPDMVRSAKNCANRIRQFKAGW